ncbi:MAG: hypothetical protein J6Y54_09685 [Lentisphaeria bacterium]|nr:hypothetical protein [Lentisphaeria bacterium]
MAALFTTVFSAEACTSWVLKPEVTESGRMFIQKVLDVPYRNRLDADIRVASSGWRWIRVGSFGHGASMGMNEKGVAITTNCGDLNGDLPPSDGERHTMASYELVWLVKSCATAEEAVEAIKRIGRNGLFVYGLKNYGTIVLVADARRAFLVEIGNGYAEAAEVTGGIHVVANAWSLPGGESVSLSALTSIRGNRARKACAVKSLQDNRVDGKYTLRGCFDTSRKIRRSKFSESDVFVPGSRKARNMSLETACFEIDSEFPAYLSCAYIALGPQRHTVYLPVPMALRQLPDKIRDGRWGEMAYAHQEAFGPEHGDLPRMTELEDKFIAEFKETRDRARRLLKDGKTDEAVKLLNDCFDRQYAEADKLMTALYSAAKSKIAEK